MARQITKSGIHNGIITETTINADVVRIEIETETPIRSSTTPVGLYALLIGLCLALHTPAWLVLLSYKDDITARGDSGTDTATFSTVFLRLVSHWLLEVTPWFANALLSIFLAGLFLYLGLATILGIKE